MQNGDSDGQPVVLQPKDAMGEMIQFVRKNSPFYGRAWKDVPADISNLEDLPVTNVDDYWQASNANEILTSSLTDGVVMRSGDSTGIPKLVYVTRSELKTIAQVKACAIAQGCGLLPGDRIANLSHHGSLYGSFMLLNTAILELPVPIVHLPISGKESIENMAQYMETFHATVLLSNVSTTCRIADHFRTHNKTLPSIRLILYSGESFHKSLRPVYRVAFPNAIICPVLYGSIDAGPIGIPAYSFRNEDDDINPVYKVLSPLLIMEIIAEDGTVITTPGVKGNVVVTHLIKRQQPMLRYPCGDIAAWTDYHAGLFQLHGRSAVGLKISSTHLPLSFLKSLIADVVTSECGIDISGFQTVARRVAGSSTGQQAVVFRIAATTNVPKDPETVRERLEERLGRESPSWGKNRRLGNLAPVGVEWVRSEDLVVNEGTGKLRDITEERF
ncbi:hypothetical protein ACLMJK_005817 [Lecanora helva]